MIKKLNLILTFIFIVLFVVVFFSNFSYATTIENNGKFQTALDQLTTNANLIDTYNSYDNCFLLFNNQDNWSAQYTYFFFNVNDFKLLEPNSYPNSYYYINNINYLKSSGTFYNSGTINVSSPYDNVDNTRPENNLLQFGGSYNNLTDLNNALLDRIYIVKGNFAISVSNNNIVTPVTPYDFSFVIHDSSTNTDHNFDFMFEEGSFDNGRSFTSDDLKEGHYIVSISSLVNNKYDLGSNDICNTWWVSGYIDYCDYSVDPKHYFVWSSGYNIPKILNDLSENDYCYRFAFKGYSSDSYLYDNVGELANKITIQSNNYGLESKYKYPKQSTFAYSNRDIYFAQDSSIYGFTGITNNLFFDESEYFTLGVYNINENNLPSSDTYLDSQVTTFAVNNDVYSYPSSNVSLSNEALYTYSNNNINELSTYENEQDLKGSSNLDVQTEDWTTLDYIKHIPNTIVQIPTMIGDVISYLFTPNASQMKFLIDEFSDFFDNHFGSFYDAFEFVFNTLSSINNNYTENLYQFYMPSIRWYNPITQEKETLVEEQTIYLGLFMEDEDWLDFWTTTRYLTSFLIYLNLIFMLYNKFTHFFNGRSATLTNGSVVGNTISNYSNERRTSADNLYHLKDSPVDHTWKGGNI